jgi:single-strand DNA-binding protein
MGRINEGMFMKEGNLTKDVQVTNTSSGKQVVNNTIAVNYSYLGEDGQYYEREKPQFIDFELWGYDARALAASTAKKGTPVLVVGTWKRSSYIDKDGQRRFKDRVVAEGVFIKPVIRKDAGVTSQADSGPIGAQGSYEKPDSTIMPTPAENAEIEAELEGIF